MADTPNTPNTRSDKDKPAGPAPAADTHLNGPGMTNGIPHENNEDATASPTSDRSTVENAGK